jgi:polyisoprenoid-binding protein YceI
MKRFDCALIGAIFLGALAAPVSAAGTFALEKPHTQAEFVVTHLGLSRVHGQIPLVSGTMTVGPNNLPTALNATFDVSNLETDNDARDKNLKDAYFQAAQYPTITFVERSIKGTPASFTLTGDLTMHGVTKTVTLNCELDGASVVNGKHHVAYTGTTKIDRRDFGMTFGPLLNGALIVGNDVQINIETDAAEE